MNWLQYWWWAGVRAHDRRILWPAVKQSAPTLRMAHNAFLAHARNDRAWTGAYHPEALKSEVEKLR